MSTALGIPESRVAIAVHGKSFAFASLLLPRRGADDAAVVYAFCRRADDAVDLVPPRAQGAAVAALQVELDSIYAGDAQPDPVLAAFQRVVRERGIPRQYPAELLAGMGMDADGVPYESLEALLGYCFRVAGTVGLMMSHVFSVSTDRALAHAAHLGMAMQLTNVARDVREDWERGRLYLPDELLARHGAPGLRERLGGPFPADAGDAVARATCELLRRAEPYYRSGDRGVPLLPTRPALAVQTARLVYSDIGRIVLRRGGDPCAPRAVVPLSRKVMLGGVACVRALAARRPFKPVELSHAVGFRDVVSV
ncbi:MAG TPA: phytoene/squalene synthase family protein [Polyangiaceae bacterium]|nr:phytoene/squalene synthase family protein [Polyangiaceae bacterium]